MRCHKVQELISARLDGESERSRDAAGDRHLTHCAHCQAFAADVGGLAASLGVLAVPPPRAGFTARVMSRIAETEPVYGWRSALVDLLRPAPLGVGVAGFCLGVVMVVLANGASLPQEREEEVALAAFAGDTLQSLAASSVEERLLELLPGNGENSHGSVVP